jgi:hypothetical protein
VSVVIMTVVMHVVVFWGTTRTVVLSFASASNGGAVVSVSISKPLVFCLLQVGSHDFVPLFGRLHLRGRVRARSGARIRSDMCPSITSDISPLIAQDEAAVA